MSKAETKERVLDAAERLFAEHGYPSTSLRSVTAEAGVNLAAVNYHFGSKVGLYKAVFERRVGAINDKRLELLDELLREHGDEPPLEAVLEAFYGPILRRAADPDTGFQYFLQLVGRANSQTGEHVLAIKDVFAEIQGRFFPVLLRLLPDLEPEDLFWRGHLLVGAMCAWMSDPTRIAVLSGGTCRSEDPDEALRHLIAFSAGALRAPRAPATKPSGKSAVGRAS